MGRRRANGEGTVAYRPNEKRWCARLTVHTSSGPKRRAYYGKTRKEAYEKMTRAMGTRAEPSSGAGATASEEDTRMSLEEWLQMWLKSAKATVGLHTYERYEQVVRNDLTPALGAMKLARITSSAVEDFRDEMLARAAPATVTYVLGVLSTAMGRAVSRGLIATNSVSRVRRPKDRQEKMRPLSEEQASKLLGVVHSTRREALYAVAAKLGLRQGELLGLFWSDVDFRSSTLLVERSVDTHGAGVTWGSTKTGESRTIALPESLAAALERHWRIQAAEKLKAKGWDDEQLIFPNQRGGVHRRNSVALIFRKDLEGAELPRVRFHDLRHTAATLMLRSGVPVNVVAQILGHKDPAMTLKRYAHVLPDMQRMAADKIDSYRF